MNNKLQPFVLEIVRRLSDDRKNRNVAPAVAGENEVLKEVNASVREILNDLVEDNILGCYDNINRIKMYFPHHQRDKERGDEI
ncbi:hypothetical protein [uncultured Duncaniella sp.]|uniref:hypothetical protein n=1 Tax=uncultured Duncaniella sp. TaxID=2768039 RepID=UPI0025B6E495|nr:hypothetical protein [uncultured Duncaniella sp.]